MQYWDDATKGLILRFESMGFRVWNQGFQGLISRVSGRKTLGFSNEGYQVEQLKNIALIFLQFVTFLTNVSLKTILTVHWIIIQCHEYLCSVMNSYAQLCIVIHTYHYIFRASRVCSEHELSWIAHEFNHELLSMNILTNTDRKQIADVPSSTPKEYLKSRTVVSVPRPPATKEKTPSPPRSCSGKRPKVERERGVNTLASCWRTGHGDHRPTIVSLANHINTSLFTLHLTTPRPTNFYAILQ